MSLNLNLLVLVVFQGESKPDRLVLVVFQGESKPERSSSGCVPG